ncbi:hypothetical protein CFK37_12250 [Virgibacillus phasianinus]|uniref:Spore coat protein YutH n=1 Tax=Virgibacillus phasianinus TaxID=2017483 RepID=A0A220U480_9BACI|nr:hypothetical protein [Virgibacillus phasianinus]ASK62865.1 hypothetical protein CFK37_12250 [Virgibacillus phasianinus]
MKNLLITYYGIQTEGTCFLDGAEGFIGNEYIYFIIPAGNKEAIHTEQLALCYYLFENNVNKMAVPVQNINGEFTTLFMGEEYIVVKMLPVDRESNRSHGQELARFHHIGSGYPYEPQDFSSYGQWKQLWINKLTAFEQKIDQDEALYQSPYHRKLSDLFPYIIGISENAIQYLQEAEYDNRFHESDQGTITYKRYTNQCNRDVMWHGNFMFDHPVRDLAEHIRYCILYQGEQGKDNVVEFLQDYQKERSLSVFSWRLLYARLLYPVHFFDLMEKGFASASYDSLLSSLVDLQHKQLRYEKFMGEFFERFDVDHKEWKIPVIDWLQ